MTCVTFIILFSVILLFIQLLRKDPKPIYGFYSQPGKWYYLKYVVFAAIYYFRKYAYRNSSAGKEGRAGQGVRATSVQNMDRAQPFSDNAKAFDAVFFISASKGVHDEGVYIISGCERRPLGMSNALFYIGLPGKGLLCSKKLPDTVHFNSDIGEFGAGGIKMTPLEPMKKWMVTYKGQMWYQNNPSKIVDVEFKGTWHATSVFCDFDTDLYPPSVIKSIAREKWTKEYFDCLKTAHQSHYEQFGKMNCKLQVDGEFFEYELPSFRDHSFGHKRDWSLMHRYGFHHIFLEDGSSISVGVVCQPKITSVFEIGFMALPTGKTLAVKWVEFNLYEHGENGHPPRDYTFRYKADKVYTVEVLVEHESVHFVSSEWEARMVERFCKFKVNGVPGYGCSEFQYQNRNGRPVEVTKTDPDWYTNMRHGKFDPYVIS